MYFFYYEFLKEVKDIFLEYGNPEFKIDFKALRDHLRASTVIKDYQRHILYKIFVILSSGTGQEADQKYKLFSELDLEEIGEDVQDNGGLSPNYNKTVYLYQFMTVSAFPL